MMSRKDCIRIAEILKLAANVPVEEQREYIGKALVWFLGTDNPNFDRQRFLDAAKLED